MAKPSSLLPLVFLLLAAATSALPNESRLQQCLRQCQFRPSPDACEEWCKDRYGQGGDGNPQREDEGGSSGNPFFFGKDSFRTALETKEGGYRVLDKFTSELFQEIKNFRVAVYEAKPRAMLLPSHWDADSVLFVAEGEGVISFLGNQNEKKESFILRKGDVLFVPAGTVFLVINTHRNDRLCIAQLVETVSVPGRFEAFFGIGNQDADSYYLKFSREVLEAAFDAPFEQLKRVFQIEDPAIESVPEEEFQEIIREASSSKGKRRPSEGESRGPFNIFDQRPIFSNQHGKLYHINASDYEQLRNIDVAVSFETIKGGSMIVPTYYSRAWSLAVVIDGKGRWEIICPHVAEDEKKRSITYRRLSSRLERGDSFGIPPGHPFVISADPGQKLRVVSFQINAENNQRILLSGRGNIWSGLSNKETELIFKRSSAEVEKVLRGQSEKGMVQGPKGQREGGSSEGRADE